MKFAVKMNIEAMLLIEAEDKDAAAAISQGLVETLVATSGPYHKYGHAETTAFVWEVDDEELERADAEAHEDTAEEPL